MPQNSCVISKNLGMQYKLFCVASSVKMRPSPNTPRTQD